MKREYYSLYGQFKRLKTLNSHRSKDQKCGTRDEIRCLKNRACENFARKNYSEAIYWITKAIRVIRGESALVFE
jgi:hypothetical protein